MLVLMALVTTLMTSPILALLTRRVAPLQTPVPAEGAPAEQPVGGDPA